MLKTQTRRILPPIAALALTLAAGCANAALPSFAVLDQDRDGFITAAEAKASPDLASVFTGADADGDGKLSEAEYKAIKG